jgi:hypothetical protein
VKSFKIFLKNSENRFVKIFLPTLKLTYLFFKFKYESHKTYLYLRSKWGSIYDSKIPLRFCTEIIMPDSEYYSLNPTLDFNQGKFVYFSRISNISHKPETNFWEQSVIKNSPENLINGTCSFELDDSYHVKNYTLVIPPSTTPNFEDPRCFKIKNELVLFGNYVEKYPIDNDRSFVCKVGFYNLSNGKFTIFDSPNGRNIEKNWIPFQYDDNKITLVYESNPLTILKFDITSLKFEKKILSNNLEFNFHGGSQFVKVGSGEFLRIVRYKFRFPRKGLVQLSFAMIHDEKLNVKFVSKPFIFRKFGFETCNGLSLFDDELIFTWGEDDEKMFVGKIALKPFMEWVYSKNDVKKSKVNIYSNRLKF